jgi:hypothetical protein
MERIITVLLYTTIAFISAMQLTLPNQIIFVYDKENLCIFLTNNNIDDNFIIIMDAVTWKSD